MTPSTISSASPRLRLRAFLVDRLVVACLDSVGVAAAYAWFLRDGRWLPGIAVVLGTVLLVGAVSAVVLGLWGVSAGKAAVGLRVVSPDGGHPIGVARALRRWALLGLATLPTLGLGTAALAWTALVDPGGRRRGWHDLWSGSWVVELAAVPEPAELATASPMTMVNLTTARLLPGVTPSVGSDA
jgi:uncharacterized RDD family membrane protein YckC